MCEGHLVKATQRITKGEWEGTLVQAPLCFDIVILVNSIKELLVLVLELPSIVQPDMYRTGLEEALDCELSHNAPHLC